MEKIDFKKKYRDLYQAPDKKIKELTVPELQYLMIDGTGNPETSKEFHQAIEAMYGVSFTLKFMLKNDRTIQPKGYYDFVVGPMECLWCMDGEDFDPGKPDEWKWTMLIMQPEFLTKELIAKAVAEVLKKKDLPSVPKIRLEKLNEGKVVQTMHIGPYNKVGESYEILKGHLKNKGVKIGSASHEIYLSDPRRTAPEKLKTILRISC